MDIKICPINVTDNAGVEIGLISLGIGSGNIFIHKYKENKIYSISPSDLWDAVFTEVTP